MPLKLTSPDWPDSQAADIKAVESCLGGLLAQKIEAAAKIDAHYLSLLEEIRRLVGRGGKRIRPQLVIKAYAAFGGRDREGIIKVAASQELFHAFILMHDDVIDRDLVRWGGPNLSGRYLAEFQARLSPADARHYADGFALLAGDLCFNLSNELLLDSGFAPGRLHKALRMVQETLFTMVGGELADVAAPIYHRPDELLSDDQLLKLYEHKTAVYSFSTPLRLGALLAGAGHHRQLDSFGRYIGIAFQIKDDILGIFGDEKKLGKPVLSDLREGKRTILMNYGLRLGSPADRQKLKTLLGNPEAGRDDLLQVRKILRRSGALQKTNELTEHYCRQAHHILLKAKLPPALSDYLAELPPFCARRTY